MASLRRALGPPRVRCDPGMNPRRSPRRAEVVLGAAFALLLAPTAASAQVCLGVPSTRSAGALELQVRRNAFGTSGVAGVALHPRGLPLLRFRYMHQTLDDSDAAINYVIGLAGLPLTGVPVPGNLCATLEVAYDWWSNLSPEPIQWPLPGEPDTERERKAWGWDYEPGFAWGLELGPGGSDFVLLPRFLAALTHSVNTVEVEGLRPTRNTQTGVKFLGGLLARGGCVYGGPSVFYQTVQDHPVYIFTLGLTC